MALPAKEDKPASSAIKASRTIYLQDGIHRQRGRLLAESQIIRLRRKRAERGHEPRYQTANESEEDGSHWPGTR